MIAKKKCIFPFLDEKNGLGLFVKILPETMFWKHRS